MLTRENVLLIGSGGREHALAWKIAQSPRCGNLYVAPGNGGTTQWAENVDIAVTDVKKLLAFAAAHNIDLTVVGTEDALDAGIVDVFRAAGRRIVGPTKAAAVIELSKAKTKATMQEEGVPTAKASRFSDYDDAMDFIATTQMPVYVKVDGPALGKGAYECLTRKAAEDAITKIMIDRIHGKSGETILIEEKLEGYEISGTAAIASGWITVFPFLQDHKRIIEGDQGLNTGGMGTVGPISFSNGPNRYEEMVSRCMRPMVNRLRNDGNPFGGFLFPNLMDTAAGLSVIEWNARPGDSETQSYMRLLKSDVLDLLDGMADDNLGSVNLEWHRGTYVATIVLASFGYPNAYVKGHEIYGLAEAEEVPGVVVFHAGTKRAGGKYYTNGGRVLNVSATADSLAGAISLAYAAVERIRFTDMYYRRDIGQKALARMKAAV